MIFESGIYYLAAYGGGLLVDQTNTSATSSEALSQDLGCGWDSKTLSCLRGLSAATIKQAVDKTPRLWGPIPDGGANVPVNYNGEAIRLNGGGARVPLLMGSNAHEGVLFLLTNDPSTFDFLFSTRFPELKVKESQIRAAYPFANAQGACPRGVSACWPNEFMAVALVLTDYMFTCLVSREATANANSGIKTWRYHYSLPLGQAIPELAQTVPHAFEIPQVFGTFSPQIATDNQRSVSKAMMTNWAAFAKDPSKGPSWGSWAGASSGNVLGEIGGSSAPGGIAQVSSQNVDANCGLYQQFYDERDPGGAGGEKKRKGRKKEKAFTA